MTIADEKYVSFTTFRKNGAAVATPVWIAPLGDGRAGFTTGATSGKVKRLAANPAVTLRPCSVRGQVRADAPEVRGTAVVWLGKDAKPVDDAILRKYRVMATLLRIGSVLGRLVGRGGDEAAVVVTLD